MNDIPTWRTLHITQKTNNDHKNEEKKIDNKNEEKNEVEENFSKLKKIVETR